jgi:uncharacterized membrane protein YdjX (TVP38/TMEM64 family)
MTRWLRIAAWLVFAAAFAFLYYRDSITWGTDIGSLARSSVWLAYGIYVLLGAMRGFALIPVTNLLAFAIPIFPPVPLLLLTLVGIALSSAGIYVFASSLKLAEHFERKHAEKVRRVRSALQKNPTVIVTAWSFVPIVPTDLICYVCGAMKISFRRFLLGVLVGEGAICAIYVFAGASLLDLGERLWGPDVAAAQVAAQPLLPAAAAAAASADRPLRHPLEANTTIAEVIPVIENAQRREARATAAESTARVP